MQIFHSKSLHTKFDFDMFFGSAVNEFLLFVSLRNTRKSLIFETSFSFSSSRLSSSLSLWTSNEGETANVLCDFSTKDLILLELRSKSQQLFYQRTLQSFSVSFNFFYLQFVINSDGNAGDEHIQRRIVRITIIFRPSKSSRFSMEISFDHLLILI